MCLLSLIAFSQDEPTAGSNELDELLSRISTELESPVQDSSLLYANMQHAVRLAQNGNETEKLAMSYRYLARWHRNNVSSDSTVFYLSRALEIYQKSGEALLNAETHLEIEDVYKERGEYAMAMTKDYKALELYEAMGDKSGMAKCYTRLCDLLYYQSKYDEGAHYCQKAIDIQSRLDEPEELSKSYRYKADNLLMMENYEGALTNINSAIKVLQDVGTAESEIAPNYNTRGNIYKFLERYDEAVVEYEKCHELAKENNNLRGLISSQGNIGHVYKIQERHEEAIPYFLKAIDLMEKSGKTQNLAENYLHATNSYEALGQYEKALKYERLYSDEKSKNLNGIVTQLETELQIKYETAKKDETIELQDETITRQRGRQLLYIGIAVLLAIILLGMYFTLKNIRKKRKELTLLNEELAENQTALKDSNSKLLESLDELKSTQAQLIQSEKMASLGELTAGIAHEIQNPLNFVNNFSEVSQELIDEMKEDIDNENFEDASAIADDLKLNIEKITSHGKRADSIVKSMLQHSRSGDSRREPTAINELTDEYVRLAYHGLRAKDKSFNATVETRFDERVKMLDIVPQNIGRVILNILTNAFYTVTEKSAEMSKSPETGDYKPTVTVSTEKNENEVVITIRDNGNGISPEAQNKIFQPFFTTKPTGKGTGLGLSMSYDIVKSHGGNLHVHSEKGVFSEFKISLPAKE